MTRADGHQLYALTVRYGQVHAREIDAAPGSGQGLGSGQPGPEPRRR